MWAPGCSNGCAGCRIEWLSRQGSCLPTVSFEADRLLCSPFWVAAPLFRLCGLTFVYICIYIALFIYCRLYIKNCIKLRLIRLTKLITSYAELVLFFRIPGSSRRKAAAPCQGSGRQGLGCAHEKFFWCTCHPTELGCRAEASDFGLIRVRDERCQNETAHYHMLLSALLR